MRYVLWTKSYDKRMRWVEDVSECIHGESTHLIHTHHAIVSTHIHTHTALHRQRPDTNPVFLNTTHQRQTTSAEEEPLLCAGRSRARPVHYTDLQRRALQPKRFRRGGTKGLPPSALLLFPPPARTTVAPPTSVEADAGITLARPPTRERGCSKGV